MTVTATVSEPIRNFCVFYACFLSITPASIINTLQLQPTKTPKTKQSKKQKTKKRKVDRDNPFLFDRFVEERQNRFLFTILRLGEDEGQTKTNIPASCPSQRLRLGK